VQLADGTKIPISKVRIGDMVLATDTTSGKTEAEPVTTLWVNHDDDLMDVTVKTASGTSTIKSTQHHLFWDLSTHAWVQAENLAAGTSLETLNGATATVVTTTVVPGAADMWDLTVDNDHDFFVVVSTGSQTAVLVHNIGPCDEWADNYMSENGGTPQRIDPTENVIPEGSYEGQTDAAGNETWWAYHTAVETTEGNIVDEYVADSLGHPEGLSPEQYKDLWPGAENVSFPF
jgi:hypothetical protein